MSPFSPSGAAVDLAVTTTTARVALPAGCPDTIRVTNNSSVVVYVRFGDVTITATTAAGMDLLPGAVEVFKVPASATYIAGITSAGTATLRLTPGAGL